jgi:hypothetical protein
MRTIVGGSPAARLREGTTGIGTARAEAGCTADPTAAAAAATLRKFLRLISLVIKDPSKIIVVRASVFFRQGFPRWGKRANDLHRFFGNNDFCRQSKYAITCLTAIFLMTKLKALSAEDRINFEHGKFNFPTHQG